MLIPDIVKYYPFGRQSSLENLVNMGEFLHIDGEQEPTISPIGYQMEESQELYTEITPSEDGFVLSFWLFPSVRKPFKSGSDEDNIKQFLFSILNGSEDDLITIYEESFYNEDVNSLNIIFNDSQISSSVYNSGILHHFYLVFDFKYNQFRMYIDGVTDSIMTVEYNLEDFIDIDLTFFINHKNVFSNIYNNGILNDLAYFNTANIEHGYSTETKWVQSIISLGLDTAASSIVDDSFINRIGYVYSTPSMIDVVSIVDDMGQVYVARSDGVLLKGDLKIWDTILDFGGDMVPDNIETIEDAIEIKNGFLRLVNSTVRI